MSRLKYGPRRNPLGYEQDRISRRDLALQTWTPARAVAPARRPSGARLAEIKLRAEQAASDMRLKKELAAYDKLDEINEAWEKRTGRV